MTPSVFWLVLLVIFSLGEAITVGLTSVWFAAGALGALVVAMLDGWFWLQVIVFLVVSAICLIIIRPLAQRFMVKNVQATNADRIIGANAIVTEEIDNLKAAGQVSVMGQTWTARSEYDIVIPKGTQVTVLRIEGVKVFVKAV